MVLNTEHRAALLAEATASSIPVTRYLRRELPSLWQDADLQMTPRTTNIVVFSHGSFDYIYDDHASLEVTGAIAADDITEARLVAAVGLPKASTVSFATNAIGSSARSMLNARARRFTVVQ